MGALRRGLFISFLLLLLSVIPIGCFVPTSFIAPSWIRPLRALAAINGEQVEPSSSLDEAFQREASVLKSKDNVIKYLVGLGAQFGSYRRRFDFGGGVWVRNASRGENVVPYLMAHGLHEDDAIQESTRPYVQSFRFVKPEILEITTDFGRRVTVYDKDFTETVPEGAVLYGKCCSKGQSIRHLSRWNGNVHETTTHTPDGGVEVTRRYLNGTGMVVEREYQPTPSDEPTVRCVEVFHRVYGQGNSMEEVYANAQEEPLISRLQRVSGCVANVHVQTMVFTNSGCTVRLDGEADAMVSRGLLALLSRVIENCPVDQVLQILPESVADHLHLRSVLSQGRNDGLANMVRVLQDEIETSLKSKSTVRNTTSSDVSVQDDTKERQPTVAMLLSGGVDSSVALNLLTMQKYNVTAFYLKIWLEDELAHLGQCPWEEDFRVCQAVCEQAGVPLETISLQQEYKERVMEYTVVEAERGRTPNPDIMCNSRVKFGCFYEAIEGRGFDHVASGHYAQLITNESGAKQLLRSSDMVKDQSYFLCALTQDQLERVLFPIGHLQKSQVRELAQEFDLPNKQRPDSQGLCFLGKVKFDEFLAAHLGERPGDIIDASTGEVLGRHRGVWYHTVGQRKGIGNVLDPKATSRGPWYVVAKDPEHDVVFASNQYDEEAFAAARSDFYVEDIQWIAGSPPPQLVDDDKFLVDARFQMKIRHGPKLVEGTLRLTDSTAGNVKLDKKDGGLAPGQYVVFYEPDGLKCYGGGVISERHWEKFLLRRAISEQAVAR